MRRSPWLGALRALAVLVILAALLDSLALAGSPLILVPPILPLYFLAQLLGRYAGGR